MLGPTGIGVLYGRESLLEAMPPWQGGGDMILSVTFEKTTYNQLPWKFEAGTPHIAGAIGLAAAIDYLQGIGMERIAAYEHELLDYATAAAERAFPACASSARRRTRRRSCRSRWQAFIRTTSARSSTPKASRSAPVITARCR